MSALRGPRKETMVVMCVQGPGYLLKFRVPLFFEIFFKVPGRRVVRTVAARRCHQKMRRKKLPRHLRARPASVCSLRCLRDSSFRKAFSGRRPWFWPCGSCPLLQWFADVVVGNSPGLLPCQGRVPLMADGDPPCRGGGRYCPRVKIVYGAWGVEGSATWVRHSKFGGTGWFRYCPGENCFSTQSSFGGFFVRIIDNPPKFICHPLLHPILHPPIGRRRPQPTSC